MSLKPRRSKRKRQSPLKDNPLRNPGQSLDEEIQTLMDNAAPWIAIASLCVALPLAELARWALASPPNPVAVALLVIPVLIFSIVKLVRIAKRVKRLRLARDGEKAVGQFLSDLREKGYRIFHDVVGEGFNIDHVIISDRGIFTIETKTYSKPSSGKSEIRFDGETLLINGYSSERDIKAQAEAQARWSRQVLKESTGKDYPVKPVIVFPGWFVQTTQTGKRSSLWVLNPKSLPAFIENTPTRLKKEDVYLAAYHLSRYIRTRK